METILLNAGPNPQYRKAILNGRQYYVVPITSIVPGVLNGSKGALYYPPDECSANVPAWNGIPIVVYHPTRNGVAVSAQDPDVMESQGVGFLDNSSFISKNGKPARLQHEAWFDVEKTRQVDNRIIQSIEANRPIELSTGLYTDNDKAPLGANDRGKGYDYIARNYRPDHLAVLPDQVGACSINDGCGVLVNRESSVPSNGKRPAKNVALDQPRHPKSQTYQGKTPNAVRKGYEDTGEPDTEADPIDDEDEEIGQGDRDSDTRRTGSEVTGNVVLLDLPSVRRLIEAGQGDLVVTNEAGQLVINPFVSEDQRKYLWSQEPEIAEAWAHGEHTSDKNHKMPDETGADVKGPLARKERKEQKKGKKTTDNSNPEGHNQYTGGGSGEDRYEGDGPKQREYSEHLKKVAAAKDEMTKVGVKDHSQKNLNFISSYQSSSRPDQKQAVGKYLSHQAQTKDKADAAYHERVEKSSVKNQMGDSMYPDPSSPHGASQQAAVASMHDNDDMRKHALEALDSSKGGNHKEAADSHLKAAKLHEKAATAARKDKDPNLAEAHDQAAGMHRKAASIHSAVTNSNEGRNNMITRNEFESDEQRIGFFAAGPGKGAKEESVAAHTASAHAERTGSKGAHTKAASAHREAAAAHREEGNTEMAKGHSSAAAYHTKKANAVTKNQGETMTRTAAQIRKQLTANCKNDKDRETLNSLSDESLLFIANAKADSSNADVKGSGDDQAGGEEDNEETSDDEFTDKAEAGVKGKGKMTDNQWLASAPPNIRSAVLNSMKIERREKSILVRRLVANVSEGDRKKALITNFMKKPLEELIELVSLLPAPAVNVGERWGYEQEQFSSRYLGAETPGTTTENKGQDDGDILDLPTLNYKEIVEDMNTAGRRGSAQKQA